MCKSLVTAITGLYLIGCTTTSTSPAFDDASARQFRQQHMELYRTMDMMPRPQPIIILRPNKA